MKISKQYERVRSLRYKSSYIGRMRYWRGHGIHSPFVYNMVRRVFMSSSVQVSSREVYNMLIEQKIASSKTAARIQNLFSYCGYSSALLYKDLHSVNNLDHSMLIFGAEIDETTITEAVESVGIERQAALIILGPHKSRKRHKMCNRLIEAHSGVSIDKYSMLILFLDSNYKRQHYKI